MLETLLLACAGAVGGIPIALWMTDSGSLLLPKLARAGAIPIELDGRILLFAAVVAAVGAAASSAAAVWFVMQSDLNTLLRENERSGSAGTHSHRLRGALVVSEVALALVVLIGAGMFFRSYRHISAVDPGFDRRGVLLADFAMASGGYTVEELQQMCIRLRDRIGAAPGIAGVTYADYAPLYATDGPYTAVQPEGFVPRNPEDVKVHRTSIAPGYFQLLRIPVLDGRDFTENDDVKAQPVMIVDQAFALRFYGGASPVGRRVKLYGKWFSIIGLVRDSKYFSFTEGPRPHYYLPFRQSYRLGQRILFFVRNNGDPESAIAALRREAAAVAPGAINFTAAPLADYNDLLLIPLRLAASLLAALGAIAFLLAGVGLYGLISYSVSQRTRELGIRIALGARPREVLGMVARQGVILTGAGVLFGLVLAFASMRIVTGLLADISPFDPLTFAAAGLFLLAVALVASFIPAYRATRIQPLNALRTE
jgi:predicted permease